MKDASMMRSKSEGSLPSLAPSSGEVGESDDDSSATSTTASRTSSLTGPSNDAEQRRDEPPQTGWAGYNSCGQLVDAASNRQSQSGNIARQGSDMPLQGERAENTNRGRQVQVVGNMLNTKHQKVAEEASGPPHDTARLVVDPAAWKRKHGARGSLNEVLVAAQEACCVNNLRRCVESLQALGRLCEEDAEITGAAFLDHRFYELTSTLSELCGHQDFLKFAPRIVWSFAKIGFASRPGKQSLAVQEVVVKVLLTTESAFKPQSYQDTELSSMLWALSKLCEKPSHSHKFPATTERCAERLAYQICAELTRRDVKSFSPQCLINSLCAVVKMGLRGYGIEQFTSQCAEQSCRAAHIQSCSTQGLANMLWAVAKLLSSPATALRDIGPKLCKAVAEHIMICPGVLQTFQAQELSMTVWAMSRLIGRRGGILPKRSKMVSAFLLAIAEAAHERMEEHTPQGLANLALGLVTLNLHRYTEVKQFMLAAAKRAARDLQTEEYPEQSLGNLCTAFSNLEGVAARDGVELFMVRAAWQAYDRDVKWQDLAEITSSISRFFRDSQKPMPTSLFVFTEHVAKLAAQTWPQKVGKQALINIGLAVVRMQVSPELVWPLADNISKLYDVEGSRWNSIDCRQWAEIKRYCSYYVGSGKQWAGTDENGTPSVFKARYQPGSTSSSW
eukprot:TRINITY_DN23910_c0_g2_i1.p1 TRINITY_DN23910_c0_g2~~TRINITY_DN23910_c0_g2_i1.p1  ORF type:complete len:738 (-),score=151.54 TRINITY_DN23910_c0_g2_i1:77-2098(-)